MNNSPNKQGVVLPPWYVIEHGLDEDAPREKVLEIQKEFAKHMLALTNPAPEPPLPRQTNTIYFADGRKLPLPMAQDGESPLPMSVEGERRGFDYAAVERAFVSVGPFCLEAALSRRGTQDVDRKDERTFYVFNVQTASSAIDLVEAYMLQEIEEQGRTQWGLDSISVEEIADKHKQPVFKAEVKLSRKYNFCTAFEVDTTGGTEHIETDIQTYGIWTKEGEVGEPPPGYDYGLIGQTDRSIEGVDIVVPKLEWTETWYFKPAFYYEMQPQWRWHVGTINKTRWRGCDKASVLFLGFTSRRSDKWTIEVQFKFSFSPTTINIVIGTGENKITIPEKPGHHYLTVAAKEVEGEDPETGAKRITRGISHATVHQIYYFTEFGEMQIGE